MRNLSEICAMAVMAKAPLAGRSKTRLVPAVSAEHAAALSAAFLRDITENLAAAAAVVPIDGLIAFAPAASEALFEGHLAAGTALILADGAIEAPPAVEGFGRCLLHAVRSLLDAGYGSACVVNSDSPTLPTELLVRAAEILAAPGDRAVLGPAEDGGYYLLGLKAAHVHLFEDISWSTEAVAEQTLERAREIGLEMVLLPAWFDVDDPPSLLRLLEHFAGRGPETGLAPYAAPATAACLQRIRPAVDAH